jgi:hypothetical protein
MKKIHNPKGATKFHHNAKAYVLPSGYSDWSDEMAGHIQRKLADVGVRIVYGQEPQPGQRTVRSFQAEVAPATEPAVEASPEQPSPAEPLTEQPQTTPETQPEPPAAPIEGEQAAAAEPPKVAEE